MAQSGTSNACLRAPYAATDAPSRVRVERVGRSAAPNGLPALGMQD